MPQKLAKNPVQTLDIRPESVQYLDMTSTENLTTMAYIYDAETEYLANVDLTTLSDDRLAVLRQEAGEASDYEMVHIIDTILAP